MPPAGGIFVGFQRLKQPFTVSSGFRGRFFLGSLIQLIRN